MDGVRLPYVPPYELLSFGEAYETRLLDRVRSLLLLDVTDHVCYVGPEKGSLAALLQRKLCLQEPVVTVAPTFGDKQEVEPDPGRESPELEPEVSGDPVENYFRQSSERPEVEFTKIVFLDAVPFLHNPKETYSLALRCLAPGGRLLIVHRPGSLNSLPLFQSALSGSDSRDYLEVVSQLQELSCDVIYDIDMIPITMTKSKWYSMLRNRFPPVLEDLSDEELNQGLQELAQGKLKYTGEEIEFHDQLLFVTALPAADPLYPVISRAKRDVSGRRREELPGESAPGPGRRRESAPGPGRRGPRAGHVAAEHDKGEQNGDVGNSGKPDNRNRVLDAQETKYKMEVPADMQDYVMKRYKSQKDEAADNKNKLPHC